ncbi:MAG: DUF4143 domain-containing protein, partial [Coriobacteriia bacterium]|nr:DUF4143 domain-containing protein [Coriobacteriia bacterium]
QRGGFPAIQGEPWERATGILQSYAQQVVARDVIERHNLSNPQAISVFSSYALAYSGRELSIRKSLSRMQSQGIKVGRSTLADALSYFEDAFLLATLAPYSRALADDSNAVVKVYAIDPGLARANSPATGEDLSQLLEDAVYLEFRRRNPHRRDRYISRFVSGKRSYEVDFVVDDSLGPDSLIPCQVCLSMQDVKTAEREIRALREAMAELGVSESLLVVIKGEEREIRVDEGVIRVVPAWQWCLEGST